MSANPCPNNTWNHTSGCTCVSNGSITSEVDIDLVDPAPGDPSEPDHARDPYAIYVAHGAPMSDRSNPDFLPQRHDH